MTPVYKNQTYKERFLPCMYLISPIEELFLVGITLKRRGIMGLIYEYNYES